jgi:hypothetical protein
MDTRFVIALSVTILSQITAGPSENGRKANPILDFQRHRQNRKIRHDPTILVDHIAHLADITLWLESACGVSPCMDSLIDSGDQIMKRSIAWAFFTGLFLCTVGRAQDAITIKLKERGEGESGLVKRNEKTSSKVTVTDGMGKFSSIKNRT